MDVDTFQSREARRVELRRNINAISPVGIYRCDIPTNADSSVRDTLYVGLYTASGGMCKVDKWKNHFYEMKGDVGMSVHEKERKQEDAYTKTQTHS